MTPNAQHKRAERERRKAAGEVRVECWIPADDHAWLKQIATPAGQTVSEGIRQCVAITRFSR